MKKLYAIFLILFFSVSAFAHEYWLEPDKFFLALNEKTAVHLYVGEGLKQDEEKGYQKSKTEMFRLFSGENSLDLINLITDDASPVYEFSAKKSGNYLLALERNWSYIKLGAKEFEDYLREDGMEYIIAEREKSGERQKEGRERYSRFIKSLIQVGDQRDAAFKKKVGLKLEITPLENPYSKKIGDNLKFQVLFNGKPLARRTVFVDYKSDLKTLTQKFITDKKGQISFKLSSDGVWLVRLVFMQRCKINCAEADWESFWGAFSFGVK
ncbi:DUF4198 domain-containing protein [soil metagenome]